MVESTTKLHARVSTPDGPQTHEIEASAELRQFLLADQRMAGLRVKKVEDDLVAEFSKLSVEEKADLDLEPLKPEHLYIFGCVAEYIKTSAAGKPTKMAMMEVKMAVDDFCKFSDVNKLFVEKAPEFKSVCEVLRKKMCKRFKILVMIDLGGSIFLRADKKKDKIDKPGDFSIKAYKYFMRPGFKQFIRRLTSHPRC